MCKSCKYFVFDSHSRNTAGQVAAVGKAVLMEFPSVHAVANHFFRLYVGWIRLDTQFDIIPACVAFNATHQLQNYFSDQMRKHSHQKDSCAARRKKYMEHLYKQDPFRRELIAEREKQYRNDPQVKERRAECERMQRSEAEVKEKRYQREHLQRSQIEVKAKRASRETGQRSQQEIKDRHAER